MSPGSPGPLRPPTPVADSPAQDIEISELTGPDRLQELEDLQMRVWGSQVRDVVPAHMLYLAKTTGGIVLAAYDGNRPVGFVLGLLGRRDGRLYHASHMLGIDPVYQGRGIGSALKWRQRDLALTQGLDLMTWTFDPLEARNAYFNVHKLGVVSDTYYLNTYGEMDDDLNRGLPSDRLEVRWHLRSHPRQTPAKADGADPLLEALGDEPRLHAGCPLDGRSVRIAAPSSIQAIKGEAPDVAAAWRADQRRAFIRAFEHGYQVNDFVGSSFILEPKSEAGDAH